MAATSLQMSQVADGPSWSEASLASHEWNFIRHNSCLKKSLRLSFPEHRVLKSEAQAKDCVWFASLALQAWRIRVSAVFKPSVSSGPTASCHMGSRRDRPSRLRLRLRVKRLRKRPWKGVHRKNVSNRPETSGMDAIRAAAGSGDGRRQPYL